MNAINPANLAAQVRSILNSFNPALSEPERRILTAVGIARAFAGKLAFPTSEVASLHSYYIQSFDRQICDALNAYNEIMIVDTKLIRELIFKFFQLRYDMVYRPETTMLRLSAFAALHDDFFPDNVCKVIQKEVMDGQNGMTKDDYFQRWSNICTVTVDEIKRAECQAEGSPGPLAMSAAPAVAGVLQYPFDN